MGEFSKDPFARRILVGENFDVDLVEHVAAMLLEGIGNTFGVRPAKLQVELAILVFGHSNNNQVQVALAPRFAHAARVI